MRRDVLVRGRWWWGPSASDERRVAAVLSSTVLASLLNVLPAAAQVEPLPKQPILGSVFTANMLRDLPTANNPLAIPETFQLQTIADGFTAGGLNITTPIRFGGYMNSWTQTQFRLGDVSITDPRTGGLPMLVPIVPQLSGVTTITGAMAIDDRAPGVSMTLDPLRPGATWVREFEGWASGSAFVADGDGSVPAIDRVNGLGEATGLVSGPLTDRVGLLAMGTWRGLSHVTSALSPRETSDHAGSLFTHLVFDRGEGQEIRALGWFQHLSNDARSDSAVHLQSTWERTGADRAAWRLFGAYTQRARSTESPEILVIDSLETDPVTDFLDPDDGVDRRWTFGARVAPRDSRMPKVGVEIDGARLRTDPTVLQEIRESVDSIPSRLWTVQPGEGTDIRSSTTFTAFADERLLFGPVTLDAGVRLESIGASAEGAEEGISWTSLLPRVQVRWDVWNRFGLAALAGYRRSAFQLPLDMLAVGNPAAAFADVAAWDGTSAGALLARVGPGTGGNSSLVRIDPDVEQPMTDELVLRVEGRPVPSVLLFLTRTVKQQNPMLGYLETAIPTSEYGTVQVEDPLFAPEHPLGAPIITAYSRPPGSYGRDRYLLTNRDVEEGNSWAMEFGAEVSTEHYVFMLSALFSRGYGYAAAEGFRPTQNDQEILGNLFVDPNAATHARGQLFVDRSHVAKGAAIVSLPWDMRLGVLARYQDGQPFGRVMVVQDLTQGPTPVRALRNGGHAFTYTGTFDMRLQKRMTVGRAGVSAYIDIYNLPGMKKEVEEYISIAPGFRTPTALQPPRTLMIGARVVF